MGREVGGGIGMGKTCEPKAFSFQCMTKFTTKKKKSKENKQTKKTKIPQVVRPQKILKIIFYIIMLQPLFVDL